MSKELTLADRPEFFKQLEAETEQESKKQQGDIRHFYEARINVCGCH